MPNARRSSTPPPRPMRPVYRRRLGDPTPACAYCGSRLDDTRVRAPIEKELSDDEFMVATDWPRLAMHISCSMDACYDRHFDDEDEDDWPSNRAEWDAWVASVPGEVVRESEESS